MILTCHCVLGVGKGGQTVLEQLEQHPGCVILTRFSDFSGGKTGGQTKPRLCFQNALAALGGGGGRKRGGQTKLHLYLGRVLICFWHSVDEGGRLTNVDKHPGCVLSTPLSVWGVGGEGQSDLYLGCVLNTPLFSRGRGGQTNP